MCQLKPAIDPIPIRKVLLAIQPDGLNQRLLEYTSNLCQRIRAGVDVLWLQTETEIPPLLQSFISSLKQQQIVCHLLSRSGSIPQTVIQQVAQDHRITVVVVNSLQDLGHDNKHKLPRWWTQLPCPLVVVKQEDEQNL